MYRALMHGLGPGLGPGSVRARQGTAGPSVLPSPRLLTRRLPPTTRRLADIKSGKWEEDLRRAKEEEEAAAAAAATAAEEEKKKKREGGGVLVAVAPVGSEAGSAQTIAETTLAETDPFAAADAAAAPPPPPNPMLARQPKQRPQTPKSAHSTATSREPLGTHKTWQAWANDPAMWLALASDYADFEHCV